MFNFFFQSSDESLIEGFDIVPTEDENQQRAGYMRTRQQTASAAAQPSTGATVTQSPAESAVSQPSTEFAVVQPPTESSRTNDGKKYYFS